jgi:hypothetical protein
MTTDKQSTAMQQLLKKIKAYRDTEPEKHTGPTGLNFAINIATELLEVERTQIIDTGKHFANFNGIEDLDIEDYFTTKFKQQ